MTEKETKPTEVNPVVYSTETGKAPRGGITRTTEATTPLPPLGVVKVARKTATKKHKPRVVAPAEPLHTDIKVHPDVWKAAGMIVLDSSYTRIEIVDHETVIVR